MDNTIITVILSISALLNAVTVIITFIKNSKKGTDNYLKESIDEALKPFKESIDDTNEYVKKLDKNQCMNYLVEFIEDSKNGIPKDEIQKKRASEVYDHYRNDLYGNSYIHDGWVKYVK